MLILTLFNGYLFLHLLLLHTLFTIQKYWPLLIHCYCIYSAHAHYISTIIHMSLQTTTRWCPDFVVHPWWFGASSWALNARWNVWLPPGISFYVLMWCVCWLQLCRHLPIYRLTCQYNEMVPWLCRPPVVIWGVKLSSECSMKRMVTTWDETPTGDDLAFMFWCGASADCSCVGTCQFTDSLANIQKK